MDNKKLIAGFGYQEGRISSWDGKRTYTASAPQLAKDCCDNGADEILIYDWSVTDEDHEAAIAVIKEVCREADAPVIAVPTSVGYGASFHGLSALLTMINSCANGISVVNIDNGYGAGYIATQINRMAVKK